MMTKVTFKLNYHFSIKLHNMGGNYGHSLEVLKPTLVKYFHSLSSPSEFRKDIFNLTE